MTVFVLEEGSYSDFHVIGIYTTRENAELAKSVTGGKINEWTLDPGIQQMNAGLKMWNVAMYRDGQIKTCEVNSTFFPRGVSPYVLNYQPSFLMCWIWARDKEHAIKIADEHRTRMIAEGVWE